MREWGWTLTVLLMTAHLIHIALYGVNLPLYDEWDLYVTPEIADTFPYEWMLSFHNEHRMLATKFLAWLFYHLTGLEMISFLLLTAAFYFLILYLVRFMLSWLSPKNYSYSFWFFPFLLSLAYENTFQYTAHSAFHLCYVFFFLALIFLFIYQNRFFSLPLTVLFVFLSVFTNAFGLFLVGSLWCVLLFYTLNKKFQFLTTDSVIPVYWSMMLLFYIPVLFFLWSIGYQKVGHHPDPVLPWSMAFWEFYFNYFSFAFGYQTISTALGVFCFFLVVFPWGKKVFFSSKNWDLRTYLWFVLALSLCSTMACVTLGRAGFGVINSKSPRYIEFAAILLPFMAVLWAEFIDSFAKNKAYFKFVFIGLLWVFTFIGFLNDWQFRKYGPYKVMKETGLLCIAQNEGIHAEYSCETVHFGDMPRSMDIAREYSFSFVSEIDRIKSNSKSICESLSHPTQ